MKTASRNSLYQRQRHKYQLSLFILLLTMLVISLVSLKVGAFYISFAHAFEQGSLAQHVLLELRLPKMLATMLAGSALAVSGVIMQGLFRNPLADPALLGMTSGASLFAASFMVLSVGVVQSSFIVTWGVGISAFIGSLIVTYLTYLLSVTQGRSNLGLLILAGVAINALCGALIGVLSYVSSDDTLRSITFWRMGSFANVSWGQVVFLIPCFIVSVLLLLRTPKYLNAMIAGEGYARMLGINIHLQKKLTIIAIALLVGSATAVAGPIAFVGLVVPHIMRMIIGVDHRYLVVFSVLFGAVLLSVADVAARVLLAPAELPIGLLTALIGAPYFIYLLLSQRMRNRV